MTAFSQRLHVPLLMVLVALAACTQKPVVDLPPPAQPDLVWGVDPVTGEQIDLTPGLNDKEPDTCHADRLSYLIGQPPEMMRTAGITNETRIIPLGGIVSQEYKSGRIDVELDAEGKIFKITCG